MFCSLSKCWVLRWVELDCKIKKKTLAVAETTSVVELVLSVGTFAAFELQPILNLAVAAAAPTG